MNKTKIYLLLICLTLTLGTCIYRCGKEKQDYALLRKSKFTIKATIINEKNYFPNRRAVNAFSYSYQFKINGKVYKGDSADPSLIVGDSIMVKYLPEDPDMNMPVNPQWP